MMDQRTSYKYGSQGRECWPIIVPSKLTDRDYIQRELYIRNENKNR